GPPTHDQATGWPPWVPVNPAASETARAVRNTTTTRARDTADEVGADPPGDPAATMRWLAGRMEWARHQPWAAEAIDELSEVPRLLTRALDRPPPRRYLGPCGECGTDRYVRRGATYTRCGRSATAPATEVLATQDKL